MASTSPRRRSPASPTASDHGVIDVVSHSPAILQGASRSGSASPQLPESRGRRALTLDGADDRGQYDAGHDAPEARGDEQDEEEDDAMSTDGEEHAYRRGRQAIPMESPGDDLIGDLLIDDDDDMVLASGGQHLPRLRGRRGFFQADMDSDGAPRSFRYRSSGGMLQRITFRRRKRGEHDVFWTAILVCTLLSFALMSCMVIYLTQTDFFASHQNDLFGTTVDNRFTVVSQQDAQIFLKSGYSNSVYSEGMISFDDGELRLGRRALAAAETQSFYGVSFFANGTASFTNRLDSPMIEGEYLHARKAVVFDDGTVMTTAANMSGGVKEVGDLNLVSQSGTVVTSAGGKPLLFVDPDGTVTVANTDAEDPTLMGITLDGARGRLSIADGLILQHDENSSSLSTTHALHLNMTTILVGKPKSGKVRFTVSGDDDEDEDDNTEAEDGGRAMGAADRAEESESATLEVAGQTSSTQKEGGDIRIVGGDGLEVGGDVALIGGQATDATPLAYGSISINADLEQTASSLTEIGSHSASHAINIHGLVSFNHKTTGVNNATQVKVAGGRFNVTSERITLDNRALSASQLHLNSNDLQLGTASPSIKIGQADFSTVAIQGDSISLDTTGSLTIGSSASTIRVGNDKSSGQVTKVSSSMIQLDAKHGIAINARNVEAITTMSGLVRFNGSSNTSSLLSVTDAAVRINPPKFRVGSRGDTRVVSIEAVHVSIGGPGANATVSPPIGSRLEIFSADIDIGSEVSAVSMTGNSVTVNAVDTIAIGDDAETIAVGSESVGRVDVQAETVGIAGVTTIRGASLSVQSTDVAIGSNSTSDIAIGTSAVKTAALEAESVSVGSRATSVSIGGSSSTVKIGSATSLIELSGTVTVNGETLQARRLAELGGFGSESRSKRFGFLDADRIQVVVTETTTLTEFALAWDSGYSSEPLTYRLEARKQRVLSIESIPETEDDGENTRHLQLSLHISAAWLDVSGEDVVNARPSKIRCRVSRHSPNQMKTFDEVVLEMGAFVEHCAGMGCGDGIFLGLDGQRIVRYSLGDSFSTQCALASAAVGHLVLEGAQYSFTEM